MRFDWVAEWLFRPEVMPPATPVPPWAISAEGGIAFYSQRGWELAEKPYFWLGAEAERA